MWQCHCIHGFQTDGTNFIFLFITTNFRYFIIDFVVLFFYGAVRTSVAELIKKLCLFIVHEIYSIFCPNKIVY